MSSRACFCQFFFILILSTVSVTNVWSKSNGKQSGCTAQPLLPERPFVVVWNHPTKDCEDRGVHLDFQKWGIVDNDRDRFYGKKIVLLYNLGKWPYYNKDGQSFNGGLPQLADLNAHLDKVDNDLKTSVWNQTFNGLAIIDMEHWRPLYWTNFDSLKIYQEKSLALARQRFPQYDKDQVLNEAIKEFDTAARNMMEQTLIRVTTKRPTGKWGYYLYPRCWDKNCNTRTIFNNDKMSWIFEKSTGLYPSIYFKLNEPPASRGLRIKNTLHETMRVKAKYAPQDAPVMPYSKNQDGPFNMFDKTDLSYAILQPANMGSSGVVLWGSTYDAKAKNECLILQDYIKNTLGPYSLSVTYFFGNCTQQLCNNHGRCVRKDYEATYQYYLHESNRTECHIPKEQLSMTKKQSNNKQSVTRNFNVRRSSQRKGRSFPFLPYLNKHIVNENNFHSSGFYKMNMDIKDMFNYHEQRKSVKFEPDVYKENEGVDQGWTKLSQFYYQIKLRETKEKKSNKLDVENHVDQNDLKDWSSLGDPNYDFDDYVCKCYPGYSGIHCEMHNSQH